ncbi:MAG: hypothetical protein LPJ94_00585 [Thauera sp.]|nr:hypothetical protein [Thauera sp.]
MPDVLAQDALAALESAIAGLLPASPPAGMTRSLRIEPRRLRPLGLGGYVGNHSEPDAALFGRRVLGKVAISVAGGNETAARAHVDGLAAALLCLSRNELATRGLHRLERVGVDDPRTLAFDIDFEFIRIPTTGEDVITDLVLGIEPDG